VVSSGLGNSESELSLAPSSWKLVSDAFLCPRFACLLGDGLPLTLKKQNDPIQVITIEH